MNNPLVVLRKGDDQVIAFAWSKFVRMMPVPSGSFGLTQPGTRLVFNDQRANEDWVVIEIAFDDAIKQLDSQV